MTNDENIDNVYTFDIFKCIKRLELIMLVGSQTMADIAIFNHTILCVIFKETQFNVSTETIEGMRENFIYNISGSSVDNFW